MKLFHETGTTVEVNIGLVCEGEMLQHKTDAMQLRSVGKRVAPQLQVAGYTTGIAPANLVNSSPLI